MSKNNFSPLPFFTSKDEQTKWYAYGHDYLYECPERGILPFQIQRPHLVAYEKGAQISSSDISTEFSKALNSKGNVVSTDGSDVDTFISTIPIAEIPYNRLFVEYAQPGRYIDTDGVTQDGVMAAFGNGGTGIFLFVPLGTFGPYSKISEPYDGEIIIEKQTTSPLDITSVKVMSQMATFFYQAQPSATPKGIESIMVKSADDDEELFSISVSDVSVVADSLGVYDYIICKGLSDVVSTYDGVRRMYIELTDGINTFYSAYFTWKNPCMSIEWYDKTDLVFKDGQICYSQGFKNKMYFNAELGMPNYEFEEEVTERNGYSYPLSQVSYKKYKFTLLVPEEVCDVMRLIRLSDVVTIKCGDEEYSATSFLMTPTWQEQGYLASVECEFATDTMVKKNGKGYYIE